MNSTQKTCTKESDVKKVKSYNTCPACSDNSMFLQKILYKKLDDLVFITGGSLVLSIDEDQIFIPINYCPICGRDFTKASEEDYEY